MFLLCVCVCVCAGACACACVCVFVYSALSLLAGTLKRVKDICSSNALYPFQKGSGQM